jgi:nucleoside-diphosphate-sugar epimerase
MKILVTGSEGSLMQAVIPLLLAQGHTVVGVDNLYRHGYKSKLADIEYKLIVQDLADRNAVQDLCQGFDIVFLAAAKLYGVGGFNHYCADILADDTTVQGNLLHSAARHKVKHVVYISSSMVYESCVQDINHPLTEDMVTGSTAPLTDYGLSKFVGERMCHAFHKQYGLDYVIWRPFNIVNPNERAMKEQGFSHVIADYLTNIVLNKLNPLPIIGSGNQIRCFTWIDDVAKIIANYSFDPQAVNQAFNIANPEATSMRALAEKIYTFSGGTEKLLFETVKQYQNDVQVRLPSIEKLNSTFGIQQFQPVDQTIEKCINILTNDTSN